MAVRWFDGVSLWRLGLGVAAGWFVTSALLAWLLVVPRFEDRPRTEVSGRLLDARLNPLREEKVLDLRLEGRDARFRVHSPLVRDAFSDRLPVALQSGSGVSLLVPSESLSNPAKPPLDPTPTVSVDAISVGGTVVLDLAVSRRWHEQNRRMATYLAPVFATATVVLTVAMILRWRRNRDGKVRGPGLI